MNNVSVRIKNITIKNLKNVVNGTLSLENSKTVLNASILGIYGQNGSGKTALIDAIQLLKYALCGTPVPNRYADFINVDVVSLLLEFKLGILSESGQYDVWYTFCLGTSEETFSSNTDEAQGRSNRKPVIQNEKLSFCKSSASDSKMTRKRTLIDTNTSEVFTPRTKYAELVGKGSDKKTDLLVAKKYTFTTSRSFIFSKELLQTIRKECRDASYLEIIDALVNFGNRELFVINTENTGLINLNIMPLSFKYKEKNAEALGDIAIPLSHPASIPEKAFSIVKKVTTNMNIVLEQLIPGLTIATKDLGPSVLKDGQPGRMIQMMSLKNNKEIPLQYESEGIKKIVSILQLLIVIYNNSSITVAIDELDDGIFEYLLGEILRIISEKGKGQLIFTSHNLRPLETLDKNFIAFTTTNPQNRYIRITGVKENNNLRDLYYRDIVLGGQKETLYEHTNNSRIALAFRKAGEFIGS